MARSFSRLEIEAVAQAYDLPVDYAADHIEELGNSFTGASAIARMHFRNLGKAIVGSFTFRSYPPSWIPLKYWEWETRYGRVTYLVIPTLLNWYSKNSKI
jgi:hypothetical protein